MLRKVALIFGGKSAEHEISLRSAKNVAEALDKNKFELNLIGISKSGTWYSISTIDHLKKLTHLIDSEISLLPSIEPVSFSCINDKAYFHLMKSNKSFQVDIAFPILHGTLGEDGTIQGLFKMLNLPFVGCGVMSSAIGMDKDMMKRVFNSADIPNAKYELLIKGQAVHYNDLVNKLGTPFFIKPANAGSSVGVHKIKSEEDLSSGLNDAFKYDYKVLAETFIKGREIECAVLGETESAKASIPGEVIPTHDFYSYEAKYLDENGAKIEIPARLDDATQNRIRTLAVKTYQALGCSGLTRVDFFLKENGDILVNEVNTIPGFTNISMYPKMWEATGVKYTDLITTLLEIGFSTFKKESQLQTNYLDLNK